MKSQHVERASYQWMLRAIGAYLDQWSASRVCVLEMPDGFAVRYQTAIDASAADARHFSFEVLQAQRAKMERERSRGEDGEPEPAPRAEGYQNVFRALGWELDKASAYTVTIDELEEGIFVSYLQLLPSHGYTWMKRMAVLGPDQTSSMLQDAHTRRRPRPIREPGELTKFIG